MEGCGVCFEEGEEWGRSGATDKGGLTYKERPDLGAFEEGLFESVFVEIVRGGGRRNDVVGVVYRPPGGDMGGFNEKMAQVVVKLRGVNGYILGDFNADLIKVGTHAPTSEFLGGLTSRGFYPLVSLPTRITDTTATLIDNIFTNNVDCQIASGLVTVRVSDHLPVYAFIGGVGRMRGCLGQRRVVNQERAGTFARKLVE